MKVNVMRISMSANLIRVKTQLSAKMESMILIVVAARVTLINDVTYLKIHMTVTLVMVSYK